MPDYQRPHFHIRHLKEVSSFKWLKLALDNPIEILIDHAHCERKAAGFAVQLMFRYPSDNDLAKVLSPIAREELEHFEKIFHFLSSRGYELKALKPPPYGNELSKNIQKDEPMRMLDSFLVAGLIEARSHERLALLALNSRDEQLKELYKSLLESEARHFGVYWNLANSRFNQIETSNRLNQLSHIEAKILSDMFSLPRVHS